MATVNKNFRVKNGLVVEGSSATVGGFDVLTKKTDDQNYIIDLIGGTATSANESNKVVKRDGSGNFSAGTITANLTGNVTGNVTGNLTGDVTGNVTGNLTGDVTGNVTGSVTGNVTGNLTGNVTGNVTGDVTGTVSDISNHSTTGLEEGTNLYYTAARAKEEAANLLVNASKTNIQISKDGSNNLTITAENGVADSTTDDLAEGSTRLYYTDTRARQAVSGGTGISYNNSTGVISLNTNTDGVSEGASNLYFTNGRARSSVSVNNTGLTYDQSTGTFGVAVNTFDSWGSASAAEGAANTYTDTAINALRTDDIEEDASPVNLWFTDARARQAVSGGTGISYDSSTGQIAVNTAVIADQTYVNNAIAGLVDNAPGVLDTLNELAAAINDDASFASTITTSIGGKVAKSGDTMTGALTLHADPSSNLHAATKQYVDAAEAAAQTAAETTAQAALNNVLNGTTDFTALDVNSVSRQVAATTGNIATVAATTVLSWNKTNYRTAKILVKAKNGSHTHVSEVIATLDTSDNIALNEYGITTTNGSLMTIDADIDSGNVRIRVTPAHNNTEVMAHATLLV